MNISESSVNSVVAHCQLFVVDSKLVKDGRMNIMAGSWVATLGRSKAPLITFTMGYTALDPAPSQPIGEYERVMVSSLATLCARHPAELSRPKNDCVVKHASLFEVKEQCSRTTSHAASEWAMIALDVLVRVPVAARESVVVSGPNLDESNATLEESPRDNALTGEVVYLLDLVDFFGPGFDIMIKTI